jgi:G3E family GTPase
VDQRAVARWLSMVSQFHGDSVLRTKGLVRVNDEAGPMVVQAVQHVVYPAYTMPCWPSEDQSSRVVVITRGMDEGFVEVLRESLSSAMQPDCRGLEGTR